MNNSQLFKEAHSIARNTVEQVGDYQVAFTIALRGLIAKRKEAKKVCLLDAASIAFYSALLLLFVCIVLVFFVNVNPFQFVFVMMSSCVAIFAGVYGIVALSNYATLKVLKNKYRRVETAISYNEFYVWQ